MSKSEYVRVNLREIKVHEMTLPEEVEEICRAKNTIECILHGIDNSDEWNVMISEKHIFHYFCYNRKGEKEMCEPKFPLSDNLCGLFKNAFELIM